MKILTTIVQLFALPVENNIRIDEISLLLTTLDLEHPIQNQLVMGGIVLGSLCIALQGFGFPMWNLFSTKNIPAITMGTHNNEQQIDAYEIDLFEEEDLAAKLREIY